LPTRDFASQTFIDIDGGIRQEIRAVHDEGLVLQVASRSLDRGFYTGVANGKDHHVRIGQNLIKVVMNMNFSNSGQAST
jgi:hypothetical protein